MGRKLKPRTLAGKSPLHFQTSVHEQVAHICRWPTATARCDQTQHHDTHPH